MTPLTSKISLRKIAMDKKIPVEEFFKLQFRNKIYLAFRSFLLLGMILHSIDLNLPPGSFKIFASSFCAMILTGTIIPLLDIVFLQDPLNTDTKNPVKYWVLAFFGDYQGISDGLSQTKEKADERYAITKNLYESKANRFKRINATSPPDPFSDVELTQAVTQSVNRPKKRITIIAAIIAMPIYFIPLYIGDQAYGELLAGLNSGFRFLIISLAIFSITPFIEMTLLKNKSEIGTRHHFGFWQHILVGHLDLHIKRLTNEIMRTNQKAQALTAASHELDKQLDQ